MTRETADRLRASVNKATELLNGINETDAGLRPAAEEWSSKEIIGHLIDSASNNHQRFVRAQFTDDLVFSGYDGEQWVSVQKYQTAPWSSLVTLWQQFNLHLARVIELIPDQVASAPRSHHNLNTIAFKTVPKEQPETLGHFMEDYVDHLEHHLDQITSRQR